MKTKFLILIGIIVTAFACNKENKNSQSAISGDYIGIFEREGNTSNVELYFNNGIYSGESEIEKFPALCNGSYIISNDLLQFNNECIWTADFDWTLILNDNWVYSLQNNILIMTNSNGDKYTLTKQ